MQLEGEYLKFNPENIDRVFELCFNDTRTCILVYACLYKLTQSDICKQTGFSKSAVSKILSGKYVDVISSEFVEAFCNGYNIDESWFESKPIVFYYLICEQKRNAIIEETSKDPGVLYQFEILNENKFTKYASKEMVQKVKLEIADKKTDVIIENAKEEKEKEALKILLAAKTKRKILRMESMVETPIIIAVASII